jgi:hypothetical protein
MKRINSPNRDEKKNQAGIKRCDLGKEHCSSKNKK